MERDVEEENLCDSMSEDESEMSRAKAGEEGVCRYSGCIWV